MGIHLEITTPEGTVLERDVDAVTVPTTLGEVGILPGYVPLMALVEPGVLHLRANGGRESVAVDGGFLMLQSDSLSVLVDGAVAVANIDVAEVERARKRAEEALREANRSHLDSEEVAKLEAKIRYQIVQQRAKRTVGNGR